jgi:L-2,4-diaminobutyrate decarboxylase
VHRHDEATEALAEEIFAYTLNRLRLQPPPLDAPRTPGELTAAAGRCITAEGLGGHEALRRFTEVLAPACTSIDHPMYLAFVPGAPTEAATLFDLVVSASNIYAGSWLEGAGAVHAENEAIAWLASAAGFPAAAGGTFVSGGTAGNLSALLAARWRWRHRVGGAHDRTRGIVLTSSGAHSSVAQAAQVMDVDVVLAPAEWPGRLTRQALHTAVADLDATDRERVFAVVATGGTTNLGIIDELDAAADTAQELGAWCHIDAAYGGAALVAPSVRHRFSGIERADSFIVDPHKWLFAPFDACALVYREPDVARAAHTQRAEYLEVLYTADVAEGRNPSDLAHHLTRRARGLPLWFSLAVHGTRAYTEAVETTLTVTRAAADALQQQPHLELLLPPELSVVTFRRRGWTPSQYQAWCAGELAAGTSFVMPTSFHGETVLRLCIVNPLTTLDDLTGLFDRLAWEPTP